MTINIHYEGYLQNTFFEIKKIDEDEKKRFNLFILKINKNYNNSIFFYRKSPMKVNIRIKLGHYK